MKFIKQYNLKKVFLRGIVLLLLFLIGNVLVTKYFYHEYFKESNKYIAGVLETIKKEYPNVDEEELIVLLNQEKIVVNKHILEKYGLDINSVPALKSYESIYFKNMIVLIILAFGFAGMMFLLFIIDSYFKSREIRKITKTIMQVNSGIYDLAIGEYYEGDLSILKDEVYKTTLMLREKAEKSIRDKNNLKDSIANISHQIKTPLTSILIMVDNLIEEEMDKNLQKEFLKDIREQIENMNFLIIALLKLSRFDADVINFKREDINIKEMLVAVLKNIAILADNKNIDVHITGANDILMKGDFNWEVEAITNIVKNSIEHSDKGKNIYIKYSDNSIYTKIEIKDEGNGISKEELKKIFERFYKGNDSNSNSIGIGLALAQEIIEKDNGAIKVNSKLGQGTIFTIKYFK